MINLQQKNFYTMIYVHSFHKQEHHIFYLDLSFYQQDFHHTTLYPHIQYFLDLVRIQPPHSDKNTYIHKLF